MFPGGSLAVRFHFNGEFQNNGGDVCYAGGSSGISFIERDLMSFFEVKGTFKDEYCQEVDNKRFHWCPPGQELKYGISRLHDDRTCEMMMNAIPDGSIAEIYVDTTTDVQGPCVGLSDSAEVAGSDVQTFHDYYSSPNNGSKEKTRGKGKEIQQDTDSEEESDDINYDPGDDSASEADDEGVKIEQRYKEFRKQMRAGKIDHLDDVSFDGLPVGSTKQVGEEGDTDGTQYEDSEFDESFDELGSDG
ncbi:unnamed protein product [Urochloa humidicola]